MFERLSLFCFSTAIVLQVPNPCAASRAMQVLDFMRFAGDGKTYGHNSRPLQPLNGRALDINCLAEA
jgi:hypothetical protein